MTTAKTVFADLEFATGGRTKQPPCLKEDFVSLYTPEQFAAWLKTMKNKERK